MSIRSEVYYVIGKVTKITTRTNPKNYHRTKITKMLVEDIDGDTYHLVRPRELKDVKICDDVMFTADVQKSAIVPDRYYCSNVRQASFK